MKEKTLFRTLVPTIAMLLIAVLALSGVTYAWFSSSKTAQVDSFELNVQAADGLLISADNASWKSTMTLDEIKTAQNDVNALFTAQGGLILSPVSASSGTSNVSSGKVTFYKAEADGKKLSGVTAAAGGYLYFDLYFQNAGSAAKTVKLTGSDITNGADTALSSALASRIGIVQGGSASIGAAISGYSGTSLTILEPNATQHTQAGINDYKTYSVNAASDAKFDTLALCKAPEGGVIADRWNASDVAVAMATSTAAADTTFTIPANQTTKVTFYVWVEGQDADCLNDVAGKAMSVDLKFSAE